MIPWLGHRTIMKVMNIDDASARILWRQIYWSSAKIAAPVSIFIALALYAVAVLLELSMLKSASLSVMIILYALFSALIQSVKLRKIHKRDQIH